MIIGKLVNTSLLSSKCIRNQNCSVKAGDVAILCLSKVIPTFLKVQYFRNYFSEVNKNSVTDGAYILLFVTYTNSLWRFHQV